MSCSASLKGDDHCHFIYSQCETFHCYLSMTLFSSLSLYSIIVHPRRDILVSCGEDRLWKVVGLPKGNVLLTGFGHTDWLSNCCFHPRSVRTDPWTSLISPGMHLFTLSSLCWIIFLNHFTEVWITYKQQYMFNVYNSIGLEISIHLWNHHHNLHCKHLSSLKISSHPLYLLLWWWEKHL